jgi:hypothetical protein
VAQAHTEAQKIRLEADDYVVETLTHLEMELDRTITQVRNGIRALQNENTNKT